MDTEVYPVLRVVLNNTLKAGMYAAIAQVVTDAGTRGACGGHAPTDLNQSITL